MTMKVSPVIHQTFKLLRRSYSSLNVESLLSEENKQKTLKTFRKLTNLRYGKKNPKRHAAILIPICITPNNEISVLYTLRSSKVRTHKNQVAFPGLWKVNDFFFIRKPIQLTFTIFSTALLINLTFL